MHAEPPGDRNHALAVRSGSSNSVHLAVRQRCSSSFPRVRYDLGLALDCFLRLVAKTEFHLFPRGTEPLEPLPGVRFESTRVHSKTQETENPVKSTKPLIDQGFFVSLVLQEL